MNIIEKIRRYAEKYDDYDRRDKLTYRERTANEHARYVLDDLIKDLEKQEEKQQDVVVEYGGHTKVVSYFCVAYVIPVTEEFSDVVVYYSTTNGDGKDESYANCSPLTIKAEPGKFIDYINTL